MKGGKKQMKSTGTYNEYDDCSWNKYSCGSEYFDCINNSNSENCLRKEPMNQNQEQPAALTLEFKVAAKAY